MSYSFRLMSTEDARSILGWRYDEPYTLYNSDRSAWEDDLRMYVDPANRYHSIRDETGELVGFYCLGPEARVPGGAYAEDALDLGMGLRPDLTGKGIGPEVLAAVLVHLQPENPSGRFRATVAAFNKRALRLCESAGFHRTASFVREGNDREMTFQILVKDV